MFPTIHLQTQEKINCFLIFFLGINFLTIILNVTNTRANGSHCSHEQKGFYIVISLFYFCKRQIYQYTTLVGQVGPRKEHIL